MSNTTERTSERGPRDFRSEEQARIDTILARLSDRDRKWLRELVATEKGAALLLDRI